MRYEANLYSGGPKAKVYRFGYLIDRENPAWKSDGIRNDMDFRRIISEAMLDEDRNKFLSLVILLDSSPRRKLLSRYYEAKALPFQK
jgi:hypothetical protein